MTETLKYLQADGSPASLTNEKGVWLSDKIAVTLDWYLKCSSCRRTTIWQQRGPWLITTFVGGLIGYSVHYLFH